MSVKPRVAIVSKSECLELLLDCMDCMVLVRIEVELFMADQMNENLFCSQQRKNLRLDYRWIDDVVTIFSLTAGTKAILRTLILMG
jgi:hypothetical protein